MRRNKIEIEGSPIPIVTAGMAASPNVGEGRWLPVLVLNKESSPQLVEVMANSIDGARPGDVNTQWGQLVGASNTLALVVSFIRPVKYEFHLQFDLMVHGSTVDYLLDSEGFIWQLGVPGQRVSDLLNEPRMVVEVERTIEPKDWDKMYEKAIAEKLRSKDVGRRESKELAPQVIERVRMLRRHRISPK